METVRVALDERSYPIYIGAGLIDRSDLLRAYVRGNQVAIITNTTVGPLYLERVRAAFPAPYQVDAFELPDGAARVYTARNPFQVGRGRTIPTRFVAARPQRPPSPA